MTFYYLATPYSKYPDGIEAAFKEACIQSGLLLDAKIPTFSPVVYGHPMAMAADLDPLDHDMWMNMSRGFMPLAHGLIICKMRSWELSTGMREEIYSFMEAKKPIFWMEPGIVPQELLDPRGRGTIDKYLGTELKDSI